MKHLVKHLLFSNTDEILEKSYLHCHCKGLHSIMLSDQPGKTIRLFIATKQHELYRNFPDKMNDEQGMSIAFHPHNCDITLHVIKGFILNWEMEEADTGIKLDKYHYRSKIREGEMKFKLLGPSILATTNFRTLGKGEAVSMNANNIHTVACAKNTFNAWFVYEGAPDTDYTSYCWSNANLNNNPPSGLYKKPTLQEIEDLLTQCDLF